MWCVSAEGISLLIAQYGPTQCDKNVEWDSEEIMQSIQYKLQHLMPAWHKGYWISGYSAY